MKQGQVAHRPGWMWWYLDRHTVIIHTPKHDLWITAASRLPLIIGPRYRDYEREDRPGRQ